jgi:hypothetical protein
MPKFFVENLTDRPLKIAIEPWADLEVLAPKSQADFEYEEPGECGFAVRKDGAVCVDIMSDLIKVAANGGEKTFKPPRGWEGQ